MGTNYIRIPTEKEMLSKKQQLIEDVSKLDLSPFLIERGFDEPDDDKSEYVNPWSKFIEGTNVHLGKRSSGWKFLWNFHENKYYSNKEELFEFIRSGRVIDEYGEEMTPDEFIKMALEWCPDGLIFDVEHNRKMEQEGKNFLLGDDLCDTIIDGLRVSPYTDFC